MKPRLCWALATPRSASAFTRRNSAVWRLSVSWVTASGMLESSGLEGEHVGGAGRQAMLAQHVHEARQRHRTVIQVALHRQAAVGAQVARLHLGLDAFGDQVQRSE